MIRFALRIILLSASFALVAVPVVAQTPGVDENDCNENHDTPAVTAQKGAQWIMVQTSQWNEFPLTS